MKYSPFERRLNELTLMLRGLLLLWPFAEHKLIVSDSATQNMVVSGLFISMPWFYLATCGY